MTDSHAAQAGGAARAGPVSRMQPNPFRWMYFPTERVRLPPEDRDWIRRLVREGATLPALRRALEAYLEEHGACDDLRWFNVFLRPLGVGCTRGDGGQPLFYRMRFLS